MRQKIELYILSLAFLFVLIGANQIPYCFGANCGFIGFDALLFEGPPVLIFCFIGIMLSIWFYHNFKYRFIRGATLPPIKIKSIESLNYENLTFLATYIIPLVCFDLDFHLKEGRNFLMLLLVLILIGWIYVKTNIFYTNPTLAILNFKLFRITTENGETIIVITRDKLVEDDMILRKRMDDRIYFAKIYATNKATNLSQSS